MDLLAALFNPDMVLNWIQAGGYIVLFGLLFGCGLGLPLPEDIPLLIAGFLVGKGIMSLPVAAVIAWCGIIGGDCCLYHLGKKYGLEIRKAPLIGRHFTPKRIKHAERLFQRYGIWVVAVARMFAGIRGAMVVTAGAMRFNFLKFVIADGIAAIASGGLFVFLGWLLHRKFGSFAQVQQLREKIQHYEHYIVLALVLVALLIGAWIWWRRRHAVADDPADPVTTDLHQDH